VTAVHHEGLVSFLGEAWGLWRAHGGGGGAMPPQFMPDTVLHPAMREGMGEAPEPSAAVGRIGYWCWETMTPLVAGSYQGRRAAVDVALTGRRPAAGRGRRRLRPGPAARAPLPPVGVRRLRPVQLLGRGQRLPGRPGRQGRVLDVDYHHGNGTQQIFYHRADVLYVSLHGDPDRAFPYFIGWAGETRRGPGGGLHPQPAAPGRVHQRPVTSPPWTTALERVAEHAAAALVVSLGLDTYGQDPIADFALSTDVYHEVGRRVAGLGLPTLVLQEGGYFIPKLASRPDLAARPAGLPARPARGAVMDETTLAAYLDRIGVSRPRILDEAALGDLHRAHLMAVPFENLSIHLAEPISLAEDGPDRQDRHQAAGRLLLRAQRRLRAPVAGPGRPRRGGPAARVYGDGRLGRRSTTYTHRAPRGRWRSLAGRCRVRQPQHLPAAL
jgi:hypothetical protein